MMKWRTWMVVVAGVASGCAVTEAPQQAKTPRSTVVEPSAAPIAAADVGLHRAAPPTAPRIDAPPEVAAFCATREPIGARASSDPDVPEAATPYRARRASEALDRLAVRVRISSERRGRVITLQSDELVEPGQSALAPTARFSLDKLITALRQQDGRLIIVQGYTDSMGAAVFNDTLSLQRAQAVCDYFVTHGIPATRLRIEGLGARRPVADNATAAGRSQNRRIEIVISP